MSYREVVKDVPVGYKGRNPAPIVPFWHGAERGYPELLNVCMELQKNTEIETFLV